MTVTPPVEDPTFVPVEYRVLGIDRRTIPMAVVVLVILLLATVVLPGINRAVAGDRIVAAGDVLALKTPQGLAITPPEGWDLTEGILLGSIPQVVLPSETELSKDGVEVTIKAATFDGTATELADRVDELNVLRDDVLGVGALTDRADVQLDSGVKGVAQVYTGLDRKGVVMAFVVPVESGEKVGVEIVATGPAETLNKQLPAIVGMAETLTVEGS